MKHLTSTWTRYFVRGIDYAPLPVPDDRAEVRSLSEILEGQQTSQSKVAAGGENEP